MVRIHDLSAVSRGFPEKTLVVLYKYNIYVTGWRSSVWLYCRWVCLTSGRVSVQFLWRCISPVFPGSITVLAWLPWTDPHSRLSSNTRPKNRCWYSCHRDDRLGSPLWIWLRCLLPKITLNSGCIRLNRRYSITPNSGCIRLNRRYSITPNNGTPRAV